MFKEFQQFDVAQHAWDYNFYPLARPIDCATGLVPSLTGTRSTKDYDCKTRSLRHLFGFAPQNTRIRCSLCDHTRFLTFRLLTCGHYICALCLLLPETNSCKVCNLSFNDIICQATSNLSMNTVWENIAKLNNYYLRVSADTAVAFFLPIRALLCILYIRPNYTPFIRIMRFLRLEQVYWPSRINKTMESQSFTKNDFFRYFSQCNAKGELFEDQINDFQVMMSPFYDRNIMDKYLTCKQLNEYYA
jgi:hypothetical protein